MAICRKEHLQPSEVEKWCLPDIVLMYSAYIEEAKELEELDKQMKTD